MLDDLLRNRKDRFLDPLARPLPQANPTTITLIALAVGLVGIYLLTQQIYGWGLFCWLLNRFLDGLDGSVARLHQRQSDLGGYLDILADFFVYAGYPIALVIGQPAVSSYLALALLLASFYINSASWLYLAAILEKRNHGIRTRKELTTITMPAGLIGGTETIVFYCLFIIFPTFLVPLFILMGGLVLLTTGQRIVWAIRHLS